MTFDIEIRYYTWNRMLWNSISSAVNLENIDIDSEGRNIRYRSSTISKNCRYRSIKDRYRLITISKFKTSISLYPGIEDFSMSINAPSISILVYDIDWSENFSTQDPEHCHIDLDFIKKIAHYTNNKEVFLTILRHHVREGHLQYLNQLRADLYVEDNDEIEAFNSPWQDRMEAKSAANDSLPCELGLRYPLLQSIMAGRRNHQTIQVRLYRIRYRLRYCIRYRIRYRIRYNIRKIIKNDIVIRYCIRYCTRYYFLWLSLSVWQAVGDFGRKRGMQDINIHLLKPARFAVDPLCSIPPSMSANVVQDDSLHHVRIPYITPGLAVAAYQIGWVDWS